MDKQPDEAAKQSEIIRQNMSVVSEMRRKALEAHTVPEQASHWVTNFLGSMGFVYFHAIWFGLWIMLNVGLFHLPHVTEFDPYPFSLLSLIVSLEAIFLSAFVLIFQNRLSKLTQTSSQLDLQVSLLAEQKASKLVEMLDHMIAQLNAMDNAFNIPPDPEVEILKVSLPPEEVLQVIEESIEGEMQDFKLELQDTEEELEQVKEEVEKVAEEVREIKDRNP